VCEPDETEYHYTSLPLCKRKIFNVPFEFLGKLRAGEKGRNKNSRNRKRWQTKGVTFDPTSSTIYAVESRPPTVSPSAKPADILKELQPSLCQQRCSFVKSGVQINTEGCSRKK
jgi:hypothetical protein